MAIAFARINYITRAKGHSAVAAAAYRSGTKIYDERRGKHENYLNHADHVVHSEIMLPAGAPESFRDRETLWNAIEAAEDRFNNHRKRAQVAVDCVLALPKDAQLTLDDLVEMTQRFAQEHFVSKGVAVDFNIHDKGDGNPHAHILRTTRRIDANGIDSVKARDLNPEVRKGQVQVDALEWEKWRNFQNNYFAEKSLDLEVDANGVISQVHLGKSTFHHPYREKTNHFQENEASKRENREILLTDPLALLNQITLNRSVFTRADLAKLIDKTLTKIGVTDPSVFQNTLAKVEGSEQLIKLGLGADGKEYYTTRAMFNCENDIQDYADILKSQYRHQVSDKIIERQISQSTLSDEQKDAVKHIVDGRGISALLGRAGTGKSYTLGVARDIWVQSGLRVSGIALSGKAADNLERSSGISSRTIESFRRGIASGRIKLGRNDVIVMDEAGMADSVQFRDILHSAAKSGAKFVYAGDPDQTLPVGPGAPMRALLERTGYAELVDIRRQKTAWMREATLALAKGNVAEGLKHYQKKCLIHVTSTPPNESSLQVGHIYFYQQDNNFYYVINQGQSVIRAKVTDRKTVNRLSKIELSNGTVDLPYSERIAKSCHYQAHMDGNGSFIHHYNSADLTMEHLIKDWLKVFNENSAPDNIIMGYTNPEVLALNSKVRQALVSSKYLRDGVKVELSRGARQLAIGERVQFLRNDRELNVSNGKFGTIKSLIRDKRRRVLGAEIQVDERDDPIIIDFSQYNYLDYGYAATVNKSQGQTVDNAFVYVGSYGWDRALAYTALSRHRESVQLYVNGEQFKDNEELVKEFSREPKKDSLYDWPWMFKMRRGMSDNEGSASSFKTHLSRRLKKQVAQLRDTIDEKFFPDKYWERKQAAAEKIRKSDEFKSLVESKKKQYADAATVYEYTEAAKACGAVWAKIFEAEKQNKARFGDDYQLKNHTRYSEAITLSAKRDELANTICQDIERYTNACKLYQLDFDKLENQARAHHGRETVLDYLEEVEAGRALFRNKLAYKIINDTKSHASGIGLHQAALRKALSIKKGNEKEIWKTLREQSLSYERSILLQNLSEDEKDKFKVVERYRTAYLDAAQLWKSYFEILDKTGKVDMDLLDSAKSASELRNTLAARIYSEVDKYRTGLNFYHIDKPERIERLYTSYDESVSVEKHAYYSAKRGINLKKYANQEYARQRVQDYLKSEDEKVRAEHADNILRYPKLHNKWISQVAREYANSLGLSDLEEIDKASKKRFFEIKNEVFDLAIPVRVERAKMNLSDKGLDALSLVESYYLQHKVVKAAWKDFYDNGKQEKQAAIANEAAIIRDKIAVEIAKDYSAYEKGIELYRISHNDIEKSLTAHENRERVAEFLSPDSSLARKTELAGFMVEHRGAHTSAISHSGIDWRAIYPYADIFNHQSAKANLASSTSVEYDTLFTYVRLKRRLARVIARKIDNEIQWTQKTQARFDRLQAERNALACQLLKIPNRDIELWEQFRLQPYQAEKHAEKHAILVSQLYTYKDERAKLIQEFDRLITKHGDITILLDSRDEEFLHFERKWNGLAKVCKLFLQKGDKLLPALRQINLTKDQLRSDKDLMDRLYNAVSLKLQKEIKTETHDVKAIDMPKPVVLNKGKKGWSIEMIRSRLNERAYDVVMASVAPDEVLNEKKSTQNKLIFGQKGGSLQVTIAGNNVGYWNDFSSTEGGGRDLLSFIQKQQNISFQDAKNWAISFLGLGESDMTVIEQAKSITVKQQAHISDEAFTPKQWERIIEAREYYANSVPIDNTLAEHYLRHHRAISGQLSKSYRFHPRVMNYDDRKYYPALVVPATNNKDEVQAIQAIYLDERTGNKVSQVISKRDKNGEFKESKLRQKQNLGPTKGACVWLNEYKPGMPIAIVEGPETSQTILEAKGDSWAVVCTLGSSNFKSITLPQDAKNVILIQDNDGENKKTENSALAAAKYYAEKGVTTWRIKPNTEGDDYNDVHQREGISSVIEALKKGQLCEKGLDADSELAKIHSQIFDSDLSVTTKDEWLTQARALNNTGQTEMALDILNEHGFISRFDRTVEAYAACLGDYIKSTSLNRVMICQSDAEVDEINQAARYLLKKNDKFTEYAHLNVKSNFKEFGVGDIIIFKEDYKEKNIVTHDRAKIIALKDAKLTVKFSDRRQVSFDLEDFNNFDYGYAIKQDEIIDHKYKHTYAYTGNRIDHDVMRSLLNSADEVRLYYAVDKYDSFETFKSEACYRASENKSESEGNKNKRKALYKQRKPKPDL